MKSGFVRFYLISAALILAVTAIGKAIPVQGGNWCSEQPILGPLQPHVSNSTILSVASLIEFVILGLICFDHQRGVSCAACALWGGACLAVHVQFLSADAAAPCDCLGGLARIIPLPKSVLSSILLACAGWLATGGLVAFRLTRQRINLSRKLAYSAIAFMLVCFWFSVHEYVTNPYPDDRYKRPGDASYVTAQKCFYLMAAGVLALSMWLILRQRPRDKETHQNAEIE